MPRPLRRGSIGTVPEDETEMEIEEVDDMELDQMTLDKERVSSIAEGQTCCLCYDLPSSVELPCGHSGFCLVCVRKPQVLDKGCPVCREKYKLKDVKTHFNEDKFNRLANTIKNPPNMDRKMSAEEKVRKLVKAYPFGDFVDYLETVDPVLKTVGTSALEGYRVTNKVWFDAVKGGKVDEVAALMKLRPASGLSKEMVNWVTTPRRDGALYLSSRQGSIDLVNMLINSKANVNAANAIGSTPVITAAGQGHLETVRRLLQADANPWHTTNVGASALVVASQSGHKDVCKELAKAVGAGKFGKAQTEAIRTYVNRGCNSQGASPLLYALNGYHKETAMLLVELKADIGFKAKNGLSVLHLVAPDDRLHDLLCMFLDRGVNPNVKTELGQTCLFDAAKAGAVRNINTLLDRSGGYVVDVNLADIHGCTSLHAAATFNHANVVRKLVEAKANLESLFGRHGWTPLHSAANEGSVNCISALIECKANINAKINGGSQGGWTPLTLACCHKASGYYFEPHPHAVEELLKRKANPLQIVRGRDTTIDVVKKKMPEFSTLIRMLEDAARPFRTPRAPTASLSLSSLFGFSP